ncbi:MAG: glycosyltransferase [Candidatus Saccharibacteria bacterium]
MLYALYNASDLFVMPNIPVANDIEGFGLVATEASSCGTPVIGSDLEGIKDAVTVGKDRPAAGAARRGRLYQNYHAGTQEAVIQNAPKCVSIRLATMAGTKLPSSTPR